MNDTPTMSSSPHTNRGCSRGRGAPRGRGNPRPGNPPPKNGSNPPNKGPKKTFHKGGDPQPGKYPIVFRTVAGLPKFELFHLPNPDSFYITLVNIREVLSNCRGFLSALSHIPFNLDSKQLTAFRRRFEAVGLLIMAQHIIYTKSAQGLPYGDLELLLDSAIPHIRSVRLASQQYGDFQLDSLGVLCRVYHCEDLCVTLIRAAYQIWHSIEDTADDPLDDDDAREKVGLWWLPMNHYRHHTYAAITNRLREINDEYCLCINVPMDFRLFNGTPVWFSAYSADVPVNIRAALPWLWLEEPDTAQAWVQHAGELTMLGLTWLNPKEDDLYWGIDPERVAINLIGMWSKDIGYLRDYFHVLDKSTGCAKTGSSLQLASINEDKDELVVRILAAVTATPEHYSMAACFPPRSLLIDERPRRVSLVIPVENIVKERERWISTDAKRSK